MANVRTETVTKVVIELDADEASVVASGLMAIDWGGPHGNLADALYDDLYNASVRRYKFGGTDTCGQTQLAKERIS